MVRAMCGRKVVDGKKTEEKMDTQGLKKTVEGLTTANDLRWYEHMLRKDDECFENCSRF